MATRARRISSHDADLARHVVSTFGGRFSAELGIDLDRSPAQVEPWFLAATLFGTRIPVAVAERTYRALADAGVRTIIDAGERTWGELVSLLDAGGYARYDFRTATRLHDLARAVRERHEGRIATFAAIRDRRALEAALDALPGWGPTTVRIFLRELRGIWPGADPPIDERAASAAVHLNLVTSGAVCADKTLTVLADLATQAGIDLRDLEAALVRTSLHHRSLAGCPGGAACVALQARPAKTS
ncbi:MAG: hypothetical protein ACHQDE_10315 [Acidimicrobiia bacterium]